MPTTKLLLKESVKHLGRVGDVVEVAPGYARNYLLPNDLAVQPTAGNIKRVEERRKEIERIEREQRADQERLIARLAGVEVSIERRANEQGRLFGSVSATDIADGLREQGFNIEPDDIYLPGKIDRIDTFMVTVEFAEDLRAEIKLWVTPDAESKAAIDAAKAAVAAEPPPAGNFERSV